MDDLVKIIRFSGWIIGGICIVVASISSDRAETDKEKANILQHHCDKLSHDIKLLSEKWKA